MWETPDLLITVFSSIWAYDKTHPWSKQNCNMLRDTHKRISNIKVWSMVCPPPPFWKGLTSLCCSFGILFGRVSDCNLLQLAYCTIMHESMLCKWLKSFPSLTSYKKSTCKATRLQGPLLAACEASNYCSISSIAERYPRQDGDGSHASHSFARRKAQPMTQWPCQRRMQFECRLLPKADDYEKADDYFCCLYSSDGSWMLQGVLQAPFTWPKPTLCPSYSIADEDTHFNFFFGLSKRYSRLYAIVCMEICCKHLLRSHALTVTLKSNCLSVIFWCI